MLLVIAAPPDCDNKGARTVEKEDISPLILLWRVWLETYPKVPRPWIVLWIEAEEMYPKVPKPWMVLVIVGCKVETEEI